MDLGIPVYEYHGKQSQAKRTDVFLTFKEKRSGVLISTNISSRGLDIPQVKWIIQVDCPENSETYIHRVGRTARFAASGKSVLFLDESESQFIEQLKLKGVEVKKIKPDQSKILDIQDKINEICIQKEDVKYLAQRAFISYVKSINNQQDKNTFDVNKIDFKKLANSFGLSQSPVIFIGEKTLN